jgi:hypothetical protein
MGNESAALDHAEVELPPAMEHFLNELRGDRKKLLKDKAFNDPAQLRGFIGQFLFPRLMQLVEMLGGGMFDTYGLAVSNANQLQRMHTLMVEELQKLGADVERDDRLPGVSMEAIDEFQQAFYAVASLLQKKLPGDKDMEVAWNQCALLLSDMVEELMGGSYADREDRAEDDDDRDREDDDREERPAEAESAPEAPAVEVPGEETPQNGDEG